jgi:hypothetical protein
MKFDGIGRVRFFGYDRILKLWFRGDVAGLSVAIHYGASKSDALAHNLVTTFESSCDDFLSGLHF